MRTTMTLADVGGARMSDGITEDLGDLTMNRQQNSHQHLLDGRSRFVERTMANRLAELFVAMTAALPRRPEPRHVFDNVAGGRVQPKGAEVVQLARLVMRAAMATKNADAIIATRASIANYFDEMKAQALIDAPNDDVSLPAAVVEAAKEVAEAEAAIAAAGTLRTPAAISIALKEVEEAEISLERFEATARHSLTAAPPHPLHAHR